jgi:hypothetical protein
MFMNLIHFASWAEQDSILQCSDDSSSARDSQTSTFRDTSMTSSDNVGFSEAVYFSHLEDHLDFASHLEKQIGHDELVYKIVDLEVESITRCIQCCSKVNGS